MRALVPFTLQRNLRVNMRRKRIWDYSPVQVDRLVSYALFLYLSKVWVGVNRSEPEF